MGLWASEAYSFCPVCISLFLPFYSIIFLEMYSSCRTTAKCVLDCTRIYGTRFVGRRMIFAAQISHIRNTHGIAFIAESGPRILSPIRASPIHSARSIAGGKITTPFIFREQFLHFQSWGKITIYRVNDSISSFYADIFISFIIKSKSENYV